jgi:hypothetical protein
VLYSGVKAAVIEFAKRVAREVFVTNELDFNEDGIAITTYMSWYMIK